MAEYFAFLNESQKRDHEFFEKRAEKEAEREMKSQQMMFSIVKKVAKILRASFCKYRESGNSFKIFNFLIFCPNKAFSELFSKIQLKDPKALEFFQNRGKFENRHFGLPRPLKIDKNDAFSFRSCW